MFALSFHEFAHAWMASKCGDNTAARMGRLTLNPMAHLDVMGAMMMLFVANGMLAMRVMRFGASGKTVVVGSMII